MKAQALTHPKLARLQKRLKLKRFETVGILELIWMLAAQHADDGDLSKFSAIDIAEHLEWEREPDELILALVDCRWLDRVEDKLSIHDWDEHKPGYLHDRQRKREKRRTNELQPPLEGEQSTSTTSATFQDIPGTSNDVGEHPGKSLPTQPNPTKPNPTKPKKGVHARPTLEQVQEQAEKEKMEIEDANAFFDHYQANGWMQGKSKPIHDWNAALRQWKRRKGEFEPTARTQANRKPQYDLEAV